jgi:hypothetical protein
VLPFDQYILSPDTQQPYQDRKAKKVNGYSETHHETGDDKGHQKVMGEVFGLHLGSIQSAGFPLGHNRAKGTRHCALAA